MCKALIIGAGGVGAVAAHKVAQSDTFESMLLASRTEAKCRAIADEVAAPCEVAAVDADESGAVARLLADTRPDVLINCALPAQNLPVMEACLAEGVHYIDTSAPEPEPGRYELMAYDWQLRYHEAYRASGVTALLSMGFDPGVVNIYCRYAAEHLFDEIHQVDIVDVNAGDHGRPFATNFNPYVNIQEVIQTGFYYDRGRWIEVPALSVSKEFDLPEVGPRRAYLIYHEELETLAKFLPGVQRMRFWMGFSDSYLAHLRAFQNVGLTRTDPVEVAPGVEVAPLELLARLLPEPAALCDAYTGQTCIGCYISGVKDGEAKRVFLYNVCDHEQCIDETGRHAVSFTTGVPAVLAAELLVQGVWAEPGVYCPEQLEPEPFMNAVGERGLPWHVQECLVSS